MLDSEMIAPYVPEEEGSSPDPDSHVQLAAVALEIRLLTTPGSSESWIDNAQARAEQEAVEAELASYLSEVRRSDALRPAWTLPELPPLELPIRINLLVR